MHILKKQGAGCVPSTLCAASARLPALTKLWADLDGRRCRVALRTAVHHHGIRRVTQAARPCTEATSYALHSLDKTERLVKTSSAWQKHLWRSKGACQSRR